LHLESSGCSSICRNRLKLKSSGNNCYVLVLLWARSKAEFISKIGIVVEEADEAVFWLECLIESGIVEECLLKELLTEANELVAILAASQRTARG
jgi:hypothetical protein